MGRTVRPPHYRIGVVLELYHIYKYGLSGPFLVRLMEYQIQVL